MAFVGGIVKPPKTVVRRQERTIAHANGESSASVNARYNFLQRPLSGRGRVKAIPVTICQ